MSRLGVGFGINSQASTFAPIFGSESAFVTTWNTENLGGTGSATKVILLPMTAGVEVDWGDGTVNNLNTHTYAAGGIKTVTIADAVTGWRFNNAGDKSKILTVDSNGSLVFDANGMFFGCSNLTAFNFSTSSSVTSTNLSNFFRSCTKLASIDLSPLDFSSVIKVENMFRSCTNLVTINATGIDTSSINTFLSMCLACNNLSTFTGVEDFDVAAAITMSNFLSGATLSTSVYSDMLINYEAQAVLNNVPFHGGNSKYSAGAAATARADLIADHTWSITDGGAA